MPPSVSTGRDLRLDLFRGLALWLIFLDHIPSEHRELDHDPQLRLLRRGRDLRLHFRLHGGLRLRPRDAASAASSSPARASSSAPGPVYIAHVFIFVIFMAQIAYLTREPRQSRSIRKKCAPSTSCSSRASRWSRRCCSSSSRTSWTCCRSTSCCCSRSRSCCGCCCAGRSSRSSLSVALYAAVQHFYWNLPAYPTGTWFFNPLAWQLIFVVGAWCGVGGAERIGPLLRSRYVVGCGDRVPGAGVDGCDDLVFPALCGADPQAGAGLIYPIDKNNMDLLRFLHFCALAILTVRFIPIDWPGLKSRWLRPDDPVRPALARDLLPRHLAVLHRSLRDLGNLPLDPDADHDQRIRDTDNDCGCLADYMVRHCGGARFRRTSETAAGRPRRRRGMRRIAGALIGICAYASVAFAGPGDACAVAAHLVQADAALPRVAAAIKAKNLKIVVAGTGSSTLAGRERAGRRLSGAARSGAAKKVAGREGRALYRWSSRGKLRRTWQRNSRRFWRPKSRTS